MLPKPAFQMEGIRQGIGSIKGGMKGQILLEMSSTQAKLVKNPAYCKENNLKATLNRL